MHLWSRQVQHSSSLTITYIEQFPEDHSEAAICSSKIDLADTMIYSRTNIIPPKVPIVSTFTSASWHLTQIKILHSHTYYTFKNLQNITSIKCSKNIFVKKIKHCEGWKTFKLRYRKTAFPVETLFCSFTHTSEFYLWNLKLPVKYTILSKFLINLSYETKS